MLQTFLGKVISLLTDWLLVLLGVSLVLWFAFTLPTFALLTSSSSVDEISLDISQKKLKEHVEVLINYYAPRTIDYGSLNITARYIRRQFDQFGSAKYQPYWTLTGRYSNVILQLGPQTKEIIVIGAHFDAESESLDIDGNASGISSLIELARHLSENEDKLLIGVQLVAYPLSQKKSVTVENMGSYQHVSVLKKSGQDVRLMLSLDNVGTFTDKKETQKYPHRFLHFVYPNTGNYISLVGRLQDYSEVLQLKKSFKNASKLPLYSFNLPESYFPLKNSSDHLNYQRHGIPAMVITDISEYRIVETDNKEIVERLDYEKMAMLVQGLYQVVMDNKSTRQKQDGLVQQDADQNSKSKGGVL